MQFQVISSRKIKKKVKYLIFFISKFSKNGLQNIKKQTKIKLKKTHVENRLQQISTQENNKIQFFQNLFKTLKIDNKPKIKKLHSELCLP